MENCNWTDNGECVNRPTMILERLNEGDADGLLALHRIKVCDEHLDAALQKFPHIIGEVE